MACDIQIVSERVIHCSVNESLGTAKGQLPITVSGRGTRDRGGLGPQSCPKCPSICPLSGTSQLSVVVLRSLDNHGKEELYLPTWRMRKLRPRNLVICSGLVIGPSWLSEAMTSCPRSTCCSTQSLGLQLPCRVMEGGKQEWREGLERGISSALYLLACLLRWGAHSLPGGTCHPGWLRLQKLPFTCTPVPVLPFES